ncbi:MAG: preprotein translocase subunit SecG [Candidatus Kuenenia sp.]|nr:preprotein translocase subunit SecG [Candidatus Kuenenia hertensis]
MVKAEKAFKWGIAIFVIFGILNAFFFLSWIAAFKIILPILCVFLIGAILLQSGKGGGLAAIGGLGDQAAFGTRTSSFLTQVTYLIGAAFIVATIFLFKLSSPVGDIGSMITHEQHEHTEEGNHDHASHAYEEESNVANVGLKEVSEAAHEEQMHGHSEEATEVQLSHDQAIDMNSVEETEQTTNIHDEQKSEDEGKK